MASIREVVEGLEILAKIATVPRGLAEKGETDRMTAHIVGARHDVICGPDLDEEPSEEDQQELDRLGWHYDSEYECWCRFC